MPDGLKVEIIISGVRADLSVKAKNRRQLNESVEAGGSAGNCSRLFIAV